MEGAVRTKVSIGSSAVQEHREDTAFVPTVILYSPYISIEIVALIDTTLYSP